MGQLTKIPYNTDVSRVESGPIQFGDDWPGIFMRGDHAAYISFSLETLFNFINAKRFDEAYDYLNHPILGPTISKLPEFLNSCHVSNLNKE